MSRLALLAVLLLAFAPSASRLLASTGTAVPTGWAQLCTSSGLQLLPLDAQPPAGTQTPAAPASADDCVYCTLAASLSQPILFLGALLPPAHADAPHAWTAPRLRIPANTRGLGSRGPPVRR